MKTPLVRNIIILSAVIAVLVAMLVVVMKTEPSGGEETPAPTLAPSYTAYKVESSNVESIVINNDSSVLTVKNLGDSWVINDLPADEVSAAKVESLISNIVVMISSIEVDANGENLADYGLDTPSTTIELTLKDGTTDKMLVGTASPVSGEYFLMVDGVDKIYSIYAYKVDSIRQPLSYYKTFSRFSADITKVDEIILDRRDQKDIHLKVKDINDQTSYNVWTMLAPYTGSLAAIDQYVDDKILSPLGQLEITTPADEGINYGFDNPSAEMTVVFAEYNEDGSVADKTEQTLIVGNTENHISYVKINDSDDVYAVSDSMLEFIFVDEFLVVSKLQGMADIAHTSKVTVDVNGKVSVMDIEHVGESDFAFKMNGADADEKLSKKMYQEIIALHVDGVYNGEQLGKSEITVTFTGYNGMEDTVIEYIPINELSYAVRRNGQTQFTIKKLTVSKMLEKLTEYEQNPVSQQ